MIWTMVLIPGPFYSFYRRIGLKRECTHCNLPHVVNIKSDAGFIAKRKIDIELGVVEILKVVPKNVVESFGNDRLTEKKETKKPVNPEEW